MRVLRGDRCARVCDRVCVLFICVCVCVCVRSACGKRERCRAATVTSKTSRRPSSSVTDTAAATHYRSATTPPGDLAADSSPCVCTCTNPHARAGVPAPNNIVPAAPPHAYRVTVSGWIYNTVFRLQPSPAIRLHRETTEVSFLFDLFDFLFFLFIFYYNYYSNRSSGMHTAVHRDRVSAIYFAFIFSFPFSIL